MLDIADAQGRLKDRQPVAIIDIGSNSVRMVIFEGLVRAPAILFNEKVSCGLGRGIETTGRMDDDGVDQALSALKRYAFLCNQAQVSRTFVLATAAAREAENGPKFVEAAERILDTEIHILTGKEEAYFSAMGIVASFRAPNGVVGDLGGGSLEIIDIKGDETGNGATMPLGVIRLEERAEQSLQEAAKIAEADLTEKSMAGMAKKRPFYAVGGTWRNIGKLHMHEVGYPLHITHAYEVEAKKILPFLDKLVQGNVDELEGIEDVSKARRALLPYGATVLRKVIEVLKPDNIVFSAYGVREGFLFSRLSPETQARDALIDAADELAILRSRSPRHARELAKWTGDSFEAFGIDETVDERRFREAACRLADIGWRAHPDYRSAQSLAVIAYGHFVQISHQGRAFISLASYFRYQGLKNEDLAPAIKDITTNRTWDRTKFLGAFFRVAYLFTAAMPGVLDDLRWERDEDGTMNLVVPKKLAPLIGEKPHGRLSQLSKVLNRPVGLKLA